MSNRIYLIICTSTLTSFDHIRSSEDDQNDAKLSLFQEALMKDCSATKNLKQKKVEFLVLF